MVDYFVIGLIITYFIYRKRTQLEIKISIKKEDIKKNLEILKETGFFDSMFKIYFPLLLIGSVIVLGIGIAKIKNNRAKDGLLFW